MKKISILAAVFAAIVFSACGNKTAQNAESADSMQRFEQAQIAAEIEPVAQALAPLDGLNANTVAEMDKQMTNLKDKIDAARKALIK